MSARLLNVAFVQSLQNAILRGKTLDVLKEIDAATLSGLLEYGCLRYRFPDLLPVSPGTVEHIPVGQALCEVASPLGLRVTGLRKKAVNNLATRAAEFHLLPPLDFMTSDIEWGNFQTRFERSARAAGFPSPVSSRLLSAFGEMAENAVLHACSPETPLAGYAITDSFVQFAVIDVGIGVRASLAQNARFAALPDDVSAIRCALETGVSCRPEGGGFGFQSVFKAIAEQWGTLRFRSGNGCVTIDGTDLDVDHCIQSRPPALDGFQVSVCCRMAAGPAEMPF